MHDQNNVFYAIALSVVILISWQYFFATSFLGKPTAKKTSKTGVIGPGAEIRPQAQSIGTHAAMVPIDQLSHLVSRQAAHARSKRVTIDTCRVEGSVAL